VAATQAPLCGLFPPEPAKGRSRPLIPEGSSSACGRDPGSVMRVVPSEPAKGRSRPSSPEGSSSACWPRPRLRYAGCSLRSPQRAGRGPQFPKVAAACWPRPRLRCAGYYLGDATFIGQQSRVRHRCKTEPASRWYSLAARDRKLLTNRLHWVDAGSPACRNITRRNGDREE
jgi:hypothetical protein